MSERQLALVTGASSGIGLELARQFADHGFDLVICAEDESLEEAATDLRARGAAVDVVRADLRTGAGVEQLYAAVGHRELDAAALNAGIGVGGGAFVDTDLRAHLDVIDLNVRGTVHLARLVLADMVVRDRGRMLITVSLVAAMPGAYQVTYNGSKSFLQSFGQGLQQELVRSAVTVTLLMPGPVRTGFFARARMHNTVLGRAPKHNPATVGAQGFTALMRGERRVVGGSWVSKITAAVNAVLSDRVKGKVQATLSKPRQSSEPRR